MRFRSAALPTLLALSTAGAAPLLSSKASVAEGNFCKTYHCTLRERREVAPETMGLIYHAYAVRGGTLGVGRTHDRAIISGTLTLPPGAWNTPVVTDFLRSFAGVSVEPALLRGCVRRAMSTGSSVPTPLLKGNLTSVAFSVECQAVPGGQVSLSVLDENFEPR